jgi:hypothetical protein
MHIISAAPSSVRIKASRDTEKKEVAPGDFRRKLFKPKENTVRGKSINKTVTNTNSKSRRVTMVPIHQKRLSMKL